MLFITHEEREAITALLEKMRNEEGEPQA